MLKAIGYLYKAIIIHIPSSVAREINVLCIKVKISALDVLYSNGTRTVM